MTFGLLNGILGGVLGGGNSSHASNTNTPPAPGNSSINQFQQALANSYNAGFNAGQQTSSPAASAQVFNNAQSNITNSLVSGVSSNPGNNNHHVHGHSSAPHNTGGSSGLNAPNFSSDTNGNSEATGMSSTPSNMSTSLSTASGSANNSTAENHHSATANGNISEVSQGDSGGGLLGGLLGGKSGLLGGLLDGKSGLISNLIGGITGGPIGGSGGGGLGAIAGLPLGLFSNLVGHDSAAKAASNGDIQGWLVNTFDHSGHSHALGGDSGGGSNAPLAILGTIGQEAGGLVGLDKIFGSAHEYDAQNGTSYAKGGSSNYGLTGGLGLGSLLGNGGTGAAGGHGGHH